MYSRNNNGHRIEPWAWGIPVTIILGADLRPIIQV